MACGANWRIIAFIGPKHVGKSTVASAFARLVAWNFVDLDELISERTGRTPAALYEEGPAVFRRAETDAVRALGQDRAVVAAGGGLVDNETALREFHAIAFFVYLEIDVDTAWRRVKAAAERRGSFPVFLRGANPEETHRRLFERRAAAYRTVADLIIDAKLDTVEELAIKTAKYVGLKSNLIL